MVLSNAPKSFWPYAFEHAVDVINRTTGPPKNEATSYEVVTGEKPKLMVILPFGCRAYPLKPRVQLSKTTIDAKAWAGINLGRVPSIPGAYNVWIPSRQTVVHTSDVQFSEDLMPWRPRGD